MSSLVFSSEEKMVESVLIRAASNRHRTRDICGVGAREERVARGASAVWTAALTRGRGACRTPALRLMTSQPANQTASTPRFPDLEIYHESVVTATNIRALGTGE